MVFACATFAARESLQVIGATAGGTGHLVAAVVDDVYRGGGPKARCVAFATFRLETGELCEICVEGRYRDSVSEVNPSVGDAVILVVSSNIVGSWVKAVRSTTDSSPNSSLEGARE